MVSISFSLLHTLSKITEKTKTLYEKKENIPPETRCLGRDIYCMIYIEKYMIQNLQPEDSAISITYRDLK